jgi:hypothetical protein
MAWRIEEERAKPFLSADERRDVAGALWRMPITGLVFHEERVGTGTPAPGPQARKLSKDSKDRKDTKDDLKDWKDDKDGKESSDFVSAGESRQFADLASDLGTGMGDDDADIDDVVGVLRMSRVNRYLRRAGLVI